MPSLLRNLHQDREGNIFARAQKQAQDDVARGPAAEAHPHYPATGKGSRVARIGVQGQPTHPPLLGNRYATTGPPAL